MSPSAVRTGWITRVSTRVVLGPVIIGLVITGMAITGVSVVEAQFAPHHQVTDVLGNATPPEIVPVSSNVIGVATTAGGTIFYATASNGLPLATPILVDPVSQSSIDLAAGATFLQYVVYEQNDGSGGPTERDIRIANNGGGLFGSPETITNNDTDDHDPVVYVSVTGERHIAWISEESPGSPLVRWKPGQSPDTALAVGGPPQIADSGRGDVVIAYARTGNIHARRATSIGVEPEVPLFIPSGALTEWVLHGTGTEDLHLAAVVDGALLYATGSVGAGLGAPVTIENGPIDGAPRISVDHQGRAVIVFAKSGDVLWTRAEGGVFPAASSIGAAAGSSDPALAIDLLDYIHIAYLQGGEVRYVNDVPPPQGGFVVQNGSGLLPLPVTFQNASTGVVTGALWDFGDGSLSVAIAPVHTYTEPGTFDVTMTVSGPGGADTVTIVNAVTTVLPANVLEVADIVAFGGQPVIQPLLATHPDPLQGFQVAMSYDAGVTPITAVNFTGTEVATLGNGVCGDPFDQGPEFLVVNNFPAGPNSELIIAVIFDFACQPFDGAVLSPGTRQTIGNLLYTVPFGLPLGASGPLAFTSGIGSPPINNSFAIQGGLAAIPYTLDGSCTVSAQPQFLFIRGDANYHDQTVDIADAVYILFFLFSGGPPPECPDSADANDDGLINIGDAIYDLSFLFAGGATIPYPYPGAGIDPTVDSLPVCSPSPPGP